MHPMRVADLLWSHRRADIDVPRMPSIRVTVSAVHYRGAKCGCFSLFSLSKRPPGVITIEATSNNGHRLCADLECGRASFSRTILPLHRTHAVMDKSMMIMLHHRRIRPLFLDAATAKHPNPESFGRRSVPQPNFSSQEARSHQQACHP